MSIPATASGEATVRAASNVQDPVKPPEEAQSSVASKAKADLNVSIVQASLSVSIASGNDPLALVYKTALTSINEELKASGYGDDALQNAVQQDNTPEGTANRIVTLSTAFYDTFRKQDSGRDEAAALKRFLDALRSSVDQGFKEAREILTSLQVLQGSVASNIDKTHELVMQGFNEFEAAHTPEHAEPEAA